MIASLKQLYTHPYNIQYPIFALFRFVVWKLFKLFRLKNFKVKVWGNRFLYIDYDSFQSMWIMYNWIVDWEEFHLIENYLTNEDIVFDIGTNMGFYTIWMSKFCNVNGKIHCFEPDCKNFRRLNRNIIINHLQNVTQINQCAVSDYNGHVNFTEGKDGENHIVNSGSQSTVKVKSIRLDDYVLLHKILQIAYMKIDVEGFELSVLKGSIELLKNKKIDIIQLEINGQLINSYTDVKELIDLLEFYNYSLYQFNVYSRILIPVKFEVGRENYFAIADIQKVNNKIHKKIQ
jgi:FkbM family methyltransferase